MQIASSYAASTLMASTATSAPTQPAEPQTRTYGAARSAGDAYSDLAAKYDLRSMTPREIDEFAEQLPESDTAAKMMILTRGERFQRHLAAAMEEVTGVDQSAALEARLNSKMDLIGAFQDQLGFARTSGGPTEALEEVIDYLQGIEARRYMPAGGVTV